MELLEGAQPSGCSSNGWGASGPLGGWSIHTNRTTQTLCALTIDATSTAPRAMSETSIPPRYYLAPNEVRSTLFEKSDLVSECPCKGLASWRFAKNGERIESLAWSLSSALGEAQTIAGRYSFSLRLRWRSKWTASG